MEEGKTAGRPSIDPQRYHNQIQIWISEGVSVDGITATMLQKSIGGQYGKVVTILNEFKASYEKKELSKLPEPPKQLGNVLNTAALEIWQLLWNQKNDEVNSAVTEFEKEKYKLTELALERLSVISDLEQQLEQAVTESEIKAKELFKRDKQVAVFEEKLKHAELNAQEANTRADDLQRELLLLAKNSLTVELPIKPTVTPKKEAPKTSVLSKRLGAKCKSLISSTFTRLEIQNDQNEMGEVLERIEAILIETKNKGDHTLDNLVKHLSDILERIDVDTLFHSRRLKRYFESELN